jgi:HSP20 family molecular chaperone IbpA
VKRILDWLRGDINAFERTHSTGTPPPDAVERYNIEINVELQGDGDAGTDPRVRQDEGDTVVEIDLPGLKEETVQVERREDDVVVKGDRAAGPFEVQIHAEPPAREEDIGVRYAADVLTLVIPPPL